MESFIYHGLLRLRPGLVVPGASGEKTLPKESFESRRDPVVIRKNPDF
jgi:hypothetical protein